MIVQRLKYGGVTGALVGASLLLSGVAHAASEPVDTESIVSTQDSVVVAETVQQSITSSVVLDSSTEPQSPVGQADTGVVKTPELVPVESSEATLSDVSATTVIPELPLTTLLETTMPTAKPLAEVALPEYSPNMPITYMPAALQEAIDDSVAASTASPMTTPIQPQPVLPPAGSLELAAVWSSVTLPLFTLFGHTLLSSRADSWPLAMVLGMAITWAFCASFVSFLKRSGYSHGARSDVAALNFATPSLNVSLTGVFSPI